MFKRLGLALGLLGTTIWWPSAAVEPGALLAEPTTIALVVSIGLSLASALLLSKGLDTPVQTDKPTTLTTRGAFTNWFVGIRRVGPVFAWAGDREVRKEDAPGGKDLFGGPQVDISYEAGWHVLGVGVVSALHEIIQGGKTIFTGPITNESHPSGSVIDLGREGSFSIYWGEEGQPINTFLGDAARVTISSRWPHVCYVVWNKKRMRGQNWEILDYVLERRPSTPLLTLSPGWFTPNMTLTGPTHNVVAAVADADEQVGNLVVVGDVTQVFPPQSTVELTGTGLPNGTYEVLRSSVFLELTGPPPYVTATPSTRIFLQNGTLGATGVGTVQLWEEDNTDGANIAHIAAELLFAPFPQGLQHDPNHIVERWDLNSLEELGQEAVTMAWRSSILSSGGETAEALLGAIMQDHGILLPLDTTNGSLLFNRVRFPQGVLRNIVEDLYAEEFPEIETLHGEQPVDRLIFSFSDRENSYGDMTIAIDEDGQASFSEHQRARKVPIVTTTLFATAASLAELRSPEELAPGAQFKLNVSRGARDLIPGEAITIEGFDEVIRVMSVEVDPASERVILSVIPDFYGVPLSDFITNGGGVTPPPLGPLQDGAYTWVEIPELLIGAIFGTTMAVMVPRIRAHSQITFSSIYLSRDNLTFALKVNDLNVQTGGTTTELLPANGPTFEAQSIEFTELGPDNANAQDLTADLTSWGLGKQLVLIVSSAGAEACFAQKSTIVSGTTRRLDGLLRARYDTRKLEHPIGATVYIINSESVTALQDALLEPTEDLWVKSQPGTSAGQVNLSAVGPVGNLLTGKGVVPIKPDYLTVRAPAMNVPAFQTGDDITIAWAVSTGTPATACGFQSAGVATGLPVIPGTLSLELLTTGDVVQDTIVIDPSSVSSFQITNAALVAAFTSEPSAFKVRITHIANGFSSTVSPSLTITRI